MLNIGKHTGNEDFIVGALVVDNNGVEGVITEIQNSLDKPYGVFFDDVDEELGVWQYSEKDISVVFGQVLTDEEIEQRIEEIKQAFTEGEEIGMSEDEECTTEEAFKMKITVREPEPLPIPVEVGQVRKSRETGEIVLIITNRYKPSMYAKGGEEGIRGEMKTLVLKNGKGNPQLEMSTGVHSIPHNLYIEHDYPILLQSELIIKE